MEEEIPNGAIRRLQQRRALLICGGIAALILLVAGGIILWRSTRPASLLPEKFATQADGFRHYFYYGSIPAGYTLDEANAGYAENILILPLKKNGQPSIVMTQQKLAGELTAEDILKNGDKVQDAAAPAAINSVEGRQVGVMMDSESKTLILLNSPGNTDKQALKSLIRGLRPVK